jgi:hypothetical protein
MAAVEIIFLGVWKNSISGISQLTLAMLGQLCVIIPIPLCSNQCLTSIIQAIVPLSIVARVGLRLAFDGTTNGSVVQMSEYSRSRSGGSNSLAPVRFAPNPGASTVDDDDTLNLSELKGSFAGSGSRAKLDSAV